MLILRLLLIILTVLQCEDGSFRVESGSVVDTLSDFPPSAEQERLGVGYGLSVCRAAMSRASWSTTDFRA